MTEFGKYLEKKSVSKAGISKKKRELADLGLVS